MLPLRMRLLAGCALFGLAAAPAYAQRADENATTSADDAFGTRVGTEGVGLYDMNNARGFSPQLGNV